MQDTREWYIVKQSDGTCEICDRQPLEGEAETIWGPYRDRQDAIARRIGLIRAGKCQPK